MFPPLDLTKLTAEDINAIEVRRAQLWEQGLTRYGGTLRDGASLTFWHLCLLSALWELKIET